MLRKYRKFVTCMLLFTAIAHTAPSQAGLVWFSRANCANNESISWDWPGNNYWLWTNSHHYKNGKWEPVVQTGWEFTYRSAAVHWGEGFSGGYFVVGNHYRWMPGYGEHRFGHTETNNCNLGYFFPYW